MQAPVETYRLVEPQDLSAIDRIEAGYETSRRSAAAAAAAALRRAGWLRAGLGAGAAATGLGLGVLLACWGLSLLLNRPTLRELGDALIEQAAAIERKTTERVEAARRDTDARVAAADARASAAEKAAAEKGQAADRAAAEARAIVQKFEAAKATPPASPVTGAKPSKSVVDFSIFRHNELGALVVTTGWSYDKLSDPAPSEQWCYMHNKAVRDGLQMTIAVEGKALPFNPDRAARAGITADDIRLALPLCEWFRGTNPNIRDGQGGAM